MRATFDIRPGERRSTWAAFAALLLVTTGQTLLETARDALFLSKIPATRLPAMYLLIAVVAVGLSRLPRTTEKRSLGAALLLSGAVTAAFYVSAASPTPRLLYVLYVWTGVLASWVTVQIWTILAGFTIEQAKRLYTLVGAGGVLGASVGAIAARWVMTAFAPRTALLFAAAVFTLAALPSMALSVPRTDPVAPVEDETEIRADLSVLWGNAFARRVLTVGFLATVTVTVVDYLFKSAVASRAHDAASLGATFSLFYAVANSLAVVAQLFVAPWIFRRVLVRHVLFLFPALLFVAGSVVLSFPSAGAGFLIAVFALKGVDAVLRYSIHKTSTELLLVPVPDIVRERVKPLVDLLGTRGGQVVASVGILLLVAASAAGPKKLTIIVLVLSLVWVSIAISIRTLYLEVFWDTVRAGGLTGKAELPELDLSMLERLFAGLNSSRDGEVLASLELLAEQHRERLIPALILFHPSRAVVLRALEIFRGLGDTDFVPIADRLVSHPDVEIAAAALRARTAVAPDRSVLEKRVDEPRNEVAITALVALMARGWISAAESTTRFATLIEHRSWPMAAEFARSVREIGPRGADDVAEDFFDDGLIRLATVTKQGDAPLRAEVARAMGARRDGKFLPPLLSMLDRHETRIAAREALLTIPGALDALSEALETLSVPRAVRVQIPRAMTLFGPERPSKLLLKRLPREADGAVRYKLLRALVKLRREAPSLPLDAIVLERAAEVNLDHVEELRRWGAALGTESDETPPSRVSGDPLRAAHHLLVDLVHDKEVHATQRVFLLLDLLHAENFEEIWRGLRSRSAKTRASSRELVDNLVRPPLRSRVLAVVDDAKPASTLTYEDALREILGRGGSTMRTLAEYRALEIGLDVADSVRRRAAEQQALAASLGKVLLDLAPSTRRLDVVRANATS